MVINSSFLVRFLFIVTLLFSLQKVMGQCYQMKLRPVLKNGKYGAIDIKTGKLVIKPKFLAADSFPGNYMLVAEGMKKTRPASSWGRLIWDNREPKKLGLVNEKGKQVLPMKYKGIYASDCDHFMVKLDNRTQLLDKNFKVIYEDTTWFYPIPQANRIFSEKKLNDTLKEFIIKDISTGRVYFQTKAYNGKPVSHFFKSGDSPKRRVLAFFEITTRNKGKNKKVNSNRFIVDASGKVIIDSLIFYHVFDDHAQLEQKNQGKIVNLITDTNFQIIPQLSYKENFPKLENKAKGWYSLLENGKRGVIDIQGNIVIPFTDKGRYYYIGKNAFLYNEPGISNTQKIIFTNGRRIDISNYYPLDTDDTLLLSRPIILHNSTTYKRGLMDLNGNLILPAVYNGLSYASSSLLFYTKENEFGFISTSGNIRNLGNYVGLAPFNEGMKLIYLKGSDSTDCRAAFVDTTGAWLPGFYKNASCFKGGYARVIQNSKTFMIDKQGRRVKFGKYPLCSHFDKDIAVISNEKQTKFGIVNKSGKILIKPKYEEIITGDNDTDCSYHALISRLNELQVLPVLTPKLKDGKIQVSAKVKKLVQYP